MFEILRTIYRRLRNVPVLGKAVVAMRQGVFSGVTTNRQRYEQQQALLEGHSAALAGLRQAVARSEMAIASAERAIGALEGALPRHAGDLNERLEFARQELFYELRQLTGKGAPSGGDGSSTRVEPRIVDEARVAAQREAGVLRLNVGCGHKPDADRINVDMRPMPGVDVVATVDELPFEPGEVDQIYSAHVMEHFPQEDMRRTILPHWIGLLKSGGEVRAVVPDAAAMIEAYNSGVVDFATLRLITFGGQEYEGDFHHTMFTPESLAQIFQDAGLTDVAIVDRGRRNGLCFECEVAGIKP